MEQSEINAQWRHTEQSNVGELVMLAPPIRKVPGLKYPYQYETTIKKGLDLVKQVRDIIKRNACLFQNSGAYVSQKRVAKGIRLDLFLLSHAPGFTGEPHHGSSAGQWFAITQEIKATIETVLGQVPFYIEDWTPDEKFQARFETYIKFEEYD